MIARRAAAIAWFTAATTSPARATPRPCGRPWRDVRGLGIRVVGGAGALALFLTVKPTAYSLRIVRVSVLTTERSRPQRRATRVVWQAAHQRGALHHPTEAADPDATRALLPLSADWLIAQAAEQRPQRRHAVRCGIWSRRCSWSVNFVWPPVEGSL